MGTSGSAVKQLISLISLSAQLIFLIAR